MKFMVVESFDTAKEQYEMDQEIIEKVSSILEPQGFQREDKVNGVSFDLVLPNDDSSIYAQFYIDLARRKYSCYITLDKHLQKMSYQESGDIDEAVGAINKFMFELYGI